MRDPFRNDSKTQLMREAQVGLTVVAILLSLFLYVAFYKITGRGRRLPEHVRNAPIARMVPSNPLPHFSSSASSNSRQLASASPRSTTIDADQRREQMRSSFDQLPASRQPDPDIASANDRRVANDTTERDSSVPMPETPKSATRSRPFDQRKPLSQISNSLTNLMERFGSRSKLNGDPPPGVSTQSREIASSKLPQNTLITQSTSKPFEVVTAKPYTRPANESESMVPATRGVNTDRVPQPLASNEPSISAVDEAPQSNVKLTSAESVASDFLPGSKFLPLGNSPAIPETTPEPRPESVVSVQVENPEFKPTVSAASPEWTNNDFSPVSRQPEIQGFDLQRSPLDREPDKSVADSQLKTADKPSLEMSRNPFPSIESNSVVTEVESPTLESPKPLRHESADYPRRLPKRVQVDIARSESPSAAFEAARLGTSNAVDESLPHPMTYTVVEGDSYWSIAQKLYHDGQFFRALYEHNISISPDLEFEVGPGVVLTTPTKPDLIRLWPHLCPRENHEAVDAIEEADSDRNDRIYVTQQGDTLFEIARQKLGQASRYLEISQVNLRLLGDHASADTPLPAGVRLVLPPHE